jgi:hypothetical protein
MQWQQGEDCAQEESMDCQIATQEEEEEEERMLFLGFGKQVWIWPWPKDSRASTKARATTQGIHHCH